MNDVDNLLARIDGALDSVKEKLKRNQQRELQHHQELQKRLAEYEKLRPRISEIARPRLEALARRFGERVTVKPTVTESQRTAVFEFRSSKAYITLTFSVAPDREIENAVLECNLRIVPVLWKFESHSEFSTPVNNPDLTALTQWLDDRIVSFVEVYLEIHEAELYEKAERVEDPIAKITFPKFAAGATLDHGGTTYFFIDESTKAEFQKQNAPGR